MKQLISRSEDRRIVAVKSANSLVLRRWVRDGAGFKDEVTGLSVAPASHIELPLSDMQILNRKLHVTLRLNEDRGTTTRELFRLGSDTGLSYRIFLVYQTTNSAIFWIAIHNGEEQLSRYTLGSTMTMVEPVTLTFDLDQVWLGYVSKTQWRERVENSSSNLGRRNPFTFEGGFTTKFAEYPAEFLAIEEYNGATEGLAFETHSNYTSGFVPVACQTELERERMVLNSYVEGNQLRSEGSLEVVNTGENRDGAFHLGEGQSVSVEGALARDVNSVRFMSFAKPSEAPWFTFERGGKSQSVYVDSERWLTVNGQRTLRTQPFALYTVWIVSIYEHCYLFCNGMDGGAFELPLGEAKLQVNSSAELVTGLQAFNLDVRSRRLFTSNAVTRQAPWWDVHYHLKPAFNTGAFYCTRNLMGSGVSSDPQYIGTMPYTNNQSSETMSLNTAVHGEVVGVLMYGRSLSISGASATRRIEFKINGVDAYFNIVRRTSGTESHVYLGYGDLELNEVRWIPNHDHYTLSEVIAIRVYGDKLSVVYSGEIFTLDIPQREVHSLESIAAPPVGANTRYDVQDLVVYTTSPDTNWLPPQSMTSEPNVFNAQREPSTKFLLSTREHKELVSDGEYESTWLLGGVAARSHLEISSSEAEVLIPGVVTSGAATLQLLLGSAPTTVETDPVYGEFDFGTFKLRIFTEIEDAGDAVEVICDDQTLAIPAATLASTNEHWYEVLVKFTGTQVQLILDNKSVASINSTVTPEFEQVKVNYVGESPIKLAALRLIDGVALQPGLGYLTPFSRASVPEDKSSYTLLDIHAETLRTRGNMVRHKQKNAVIEGFMQTSIAEHLPPPVTHWPIFEHKDLQTSIAVKEDAVHTPGAEMYVAPVQAFVVEKREVQTPDIPVVHKNTTSFTTLERLPPKELSTPEVHKNTTTFVVVEKLPL